MQGLSVPDLSQGFERLQAVAHIWKRPILQKSWAKYHLFSISFGGDIFSFIHRLPLGLVFKLGTTTCFLLSSMNSGCVDM